MAVSILNACAHAQGLCKRMMASSRTGLSDKMAAQPFSADTIRSVS